MQDAGTGLDAAGMQLLAEHFDPAFYLSRYEDVRAAGGDPALHYALAGWREGRRPNAWFDTAYYLASNRDVAQAAVNPLWHFLVQGRAEGRAAARPASLQRDRLDRVRTASQAGARHAAPRDATALDAEAVRRHVALACLGARGLALSASHDRYDAILGGTQLLVADEQAKFNGARVAYLHLSPVVARVTLAPLDADSSVQLVLDGRMLGVARYEAVAAALAAIELAPEAARILVVHCLLGHDERGLAAAAAALETTVNLFWVHDFSSLCEGLHLLRDDIAGCGAPPPASLACRVCIHGDSRGGHRERMLWLFGTLAFHVVAPSRSALDLWRRGAGLPHLSARVHAHCRLFLPPRRRTADGEAIRVGFVGFAVYHKGWPLFERLAEAGGSECRFSHFADAEHLTSHPGIEPVAVRVAPNNRLAMTQALAAHGIDIALVLSPWPETFCFVAYEAMAAGAAVIALTGSGNVADLVRLTGRGVVVASFDEALALLRDGGVRALADAASQEHSPGGLVHCGTSATLDLNLDATEPQPLEALLTGDPDLALIAGGAVVRPTLHDGVYRFALPPGCDPGRLVSRSYVPALMYVGSTDHRRLGVAVAALALDGVTVPPGGPGRRIGWHAPEHGWQWTDGDAGLALAGAAELSVTLLPMAAYWRCLLAPGG